MIRRSTAIATAAIMLSLLLHFLGLSFTRPRQPEQPAADATTEAVALGNAFEDVADTLSEPVQPEPAQTPEPPVEPPPEPETADTPTSEALVASSNPQRVFAPDTGSAKVVKPETTGQPEIKEGRAPEPETVEPSDGEDAQVVGENLTPPVETETNAEMPEGNPDASPEPVKAAAAEPELRAPVSPAPQQSAALSDSVAPLPPVTPSPEPLSIPIIPMEQETVEPEYPASVATSEDSGGSDLAVAKSPRPRLREDRPFAELRAVPDGSQKFSELLFPPPIESPLTAYLRNRNDLVVRQNAGTQSGGLGFQNSRGPGNSDVTNYAGQVLVHLNRTPVVHVSARGFARVLFEINPDGTLAWVKVIDGTNSQDVDRAAKEQVRNAAPFPRPPQGATRKLSFVYQIN